MKATFAKHEDGMSWIPGAVITGLLALLYVPLYLIGVVA